MSEQFYFIYTHLPTCHTWPCTVKFTEKQWNYQHLSSFSDYSWTLLKHFGSITKHFGLTYSATPVGWMSGCLTHSSQVIVTWIQIDQKIVLPSFTKTSLRGSCANFVASISTVVTLLEFPRRSFFKHQQTTRNCTIRKLIQNWSAKFKTNLPWRPNWTVKATF